MQNQFGIFLLFVLTLFSCYRKTETCIAVLDSEFMFINKITDFEDNNIQMNYNSFEMSYSYKKNTIKRLDSLFNLGDNLVLDFKQNADILPYLQIVDNYDNTFTKLTNIYLPNIKEYANHRNVFYFENLISKVEDKCEERMMTKVMIYQIRSYNNYLKSLVLNSENYPLIVAW